MSKRIGFLATGSELVTGEILNTNGQKMAQAMMDFGMTVGEHVVADDDMHNLTRSLRFLLDSHDCVITSGGLGPTTDDITRNAIAEVLGLELIYHQDSFDRLSERLAKRNIPVPESNRQQAYFPEGAEIYPNENGTADACMIIAGDKIVVMLPGPPRECLPIFEQKVLPTLREQGFASGKRLYRWRLMGVSESAMGEQIESALAEFNLTIGYRAHYPYLDIKLQLDQSDDLERICDTVYQLVKPYLVTTENVHISTVLQHALLHYPTHITICDLATKDSFASEMVTPNNHQKLNFVSSEDELDGQHCVVIRGFETYWETKPDCYMTELTVELIHDGEKQSFTQEIYLRGSESMRYAIEFIAHRIYQAWFQQ